MKSTDERESLPGGDATCDRLRVDFVGSFLRPTILKEAFAAYDDGNLEKSELTAVADRTIEDLVAEELRHGLPVVGDGKFRRHQFMESFSEVAGMERFYAAILASPASRAIGAPLPKALELSPGKEVGGPREQSRAGCVSRETTRLQTCRATFIIKSIFFH